jgi:hypothetical protein
MSNDVETVAQSLEDFIAAVDQASQARRTTTTAPFQGSVGQPHSGRVRTKEQIYRGCLAPLSPEDRATLHEIIEKMRGAT